LERLLALVARHADQGIAHDIESMTLVDRWAAYRRLARIDREARFA
jgi:hypothetical protein